MREPTPEQRAAIEARGKVIVSAAAGSGKTYVMVCRFLALLMQGERIEDMLAVTFTSKAAAQMRDRIRRALLEEMAEDGNLRRALDALPAADICTIHSLCGRIIRTYFYLVGVDPAFRIVGEEDAECLALSARAMDRVFEEAYASGELEELLAVYFRKKKDARLKKNVLQLYAKARLAPDYRAWLEKTAEGGDLFDDAVRYLADLIAPAARRALSELKALGEDVARHVPAGQAYYGALLETVAYLADGDLFVMREAGRVAIPRSPTRSKKDAENYRVLTALQETAAWAKKQRELLAGLADEATERNDCAAAERLGRALAKLTLAYDAAFSEVKREAGVLDYGDLEHLALEVLKTEEGRRAIRSKYKYIFVDEYQDVNPMQERILNELAGEDVFLVGDAKQAIYGFRGSKTEYFLKKAGGVDGFSALPLDTNFRSARRILEAVNRVFSALLGAAYTPVRGSVAEEGEVRVHLLPAAAKEKRARGVYSVAAAQEHADPDPIARKVAAIVEAECGRRETLGRTVVEDGKERPVRYGDIAVLVRKNTKSAGPIVYELGRRGIPVSATAEVNVCDYFEVRMLLDWLSYLDNSEQDIPMASAMLSAIGGFTEDDLAAIRLGTQETSFRAACAAYRARGDALAQRIDRFLLAAARYRDLARVRPASEMLCLLLAEGLEAQIAAKGGRSALARVRRLVAESETSGDVHDFLRRLEDCGGEISLSESGGENAVKVMTMHTAKGLEFPVVILTELDLEFHGVDRDDLMYTDRFGCAPRYHDLERHTYRDTVLRLAAAQYMKREQIEGERNVLYVAMTRACSRLHMIFKASGVYRPQEACKFSDFLPRDRLEEYVAFEEEAEEAPPAEGLVYRSDAAHIAAIEGARTPYAFPASTQIPVKNSATGLMRLQAHLPARGENEARPAEERGELMGGFDPDTGTAYHAFLEHADFSGSAEAELARMKEMGMLPPEMLEKLDPARLERILALPYFKRLASKRLFREQSFLVSFPARDFAEIYGEATDDEVIYQGAIDLLVEEGEGRYTVVDYKYSALPAAAIREKYAVQLKLYRKTVAKIMRVPPENVAVRVLNIARGEEIEI